MKKTSLITLILITMVLTTSCKNNSIENQVEPDYSHFQSSNNVDNYLDDEELSEESDNGNASENLSKKEWPYELDFDGITSNKSYKTGNLNTNFKSTSFSALICPDYEHDLIYYVNYGKDNYIYQLDDGVSTLLVDKEAHSLQLWDNELYFIEDEESSSRKIGSIYCLNLDTKVLRLVQDTNAENLYIDTSGLFYYSYTDTGHFSGVLLEFENQEPKQVDYIFPTSYNEFQIHGSHEGIYIFNSHTQEKTFIAPGEYINYKPMLHNEYFMFIRGASIYTLNLLNGEKKIFNLNEYEKMEYDVVYIFDYCGIDNKIYATDGGSCFIINMDSEEIERYMIITINFEDEYTNFEDEYTNFEDKYRIDNLFTDGDKLYGLITYSDDNSMELVELFITEHEFYTVLSPFIVGKKELNQ